MKKIEFENILREMGVDIIKTRFSAKSRFQANRYKPEFVGWECWIYTPKNSIGFLVTQAEFENKEYFRESIETLKC